MKVNLLGFYKNEERNNRGVKLEDVWNYTDIKLERNHNYIQWLFPTDQRSKWNWSAPVLTKEDIEMLRSDVTVMTNFRKSLTIFFSFLGFSLCGDSVSIADDLNKKSQNWLTKNNHNYKRISRILRFLTIFEFVEIKKSLTRVLDIVYKENKDVISETTYSVWKNI